MNEQVKSAYNCPISYELFAYDEALARLKASLRLGISPMLETVIDMLEVLGRPDSYTCCIQIAGTNGKTSSSRYTAALLHAHGYKTALYTSPELVSYTERMEVDQQPVSEALFAEGLSVAFAAGELVNKGRLEAGMKPYDITEFDLLTVAALFIFAQEGVDFAVLECGMGGRWDATSAAKIKHVAITGIGLDHIHVLGSTLEAIAGEKAAIIKPSRSCVLGSLSLDPPSVAAVMQDEFEAAGVRPLVMRPKSESDLALPLQNKQLIAGIPLVEALGEAFACAKEASWSIEHHPESLDDALILSVTTPRSCYQGLRAYKPSYQAANIALALCLTENVLDSALEPELSAQAIANCPTPGRFDLIRQKPLLMIDACHNPQSVEVFLSSFHELIASMKEAPVLLCAALADKDAKSMVALLAKSFSEVVVTQTKSARALTYTELSSYFKEAGTSVVGEYPSVEEALCALADRPCIALGSITLAGEVAALSKRDELS